MLSVLISPQIWGKGCPDEGGHWWCQMGHQLVPIGRVYKALRYLLWFCSCFEVNSLLPPFGGRGDTMLLCVCGPRDGAIFVCGLSTGWYCVCVVYRVVWYLSVEVVKVWWKWALVVITPMTS